MFTLTLLKLTAKPNFKTFNSPPSYPPPPILQAKYVETAPLLGVGLLASGAVRAAA
jgi:hypothetical protein